MKIIKKHIPTRLVYKTHRFYKRDLEQHQLELDDDLYCRQNQQLFQKYNQQQPSSDFPQGLANIDHIRQFRESDILKIDGSHYRTSYDGNLMLSSLGIGTYKGLIDRQTDLKLFNAIQESIFSKGVNYIDSCISWRYMRSQRTIAAAIRYLKEEHSIDRQALVLAAKVGFVPEDVDNQLLDHQFVNNLVSNGSVQQQEIINNHCMNPAFIQKSIDCTLDNLQVGAVDIMYLTNLESQMNRDNQDYQKYKMEDQLARVFEVFESNIRDQKIGCYGLSTWNCLRVDSQNSFHLELQQVMKVAEKVGGKQHGFKYLQAPMNIMMPELFFEKYQNIDGKPVSTIKLCEELKINLITSSPLLSGTMINVPLQINKLPINYLSSRHLQFIRSIPSDCLVSTVVGMKTSHHVKKNLEVCQHSRLSEQEFWDVLSPANIRQEQPEEQVSGFDIVS